MKAKTPKQNGNQNGTRDYSHLPRARDFKLPKVISPELRELMDATREAMEALALEEKVWQKAPYLILRYSPRLNIRSKTGLAIA